jgi:hypothetical protein
VSDGGDTEQADIAPASRSLIHERYGNFMNGRGTAAS